MGEWLAANWLQVLSAFFLVLTYSTHIWFQYRRDQREKEAHDREHEIHQIVLENNGVKPETPKKVIE